VAALVASGLPSEAFLFLGFLPRKAQARRAALADLAALPWTLVLYEAPHRLLKLLEDVLAVLGDRPICVARELTKLYEELWRGNVSGGLAHFGSGPVRGEITVVIGGREESADLPWSAEAVQAALRELLAEGVSHRDAAARVAARANWPKRDVYRLG
jgi:16S rRNA (cytidine1402-2'-O)-methyltransferase